MKLNCLNIMKSCYDVEDFKNDHHLIVNEGDIK